MLFNNNKNEKGENGASTDAPCKCNEMKKYGLILVGLIILAIVAKTVILPKLTK